MTRARWGGVGLVLVACGAPNVESVAPVPAPQSTASPHEASRPSEAQAAAAPAPDAHGPATPPVSAASQAQFARGMELLARDPGAALTAFVAAGKESEGNYLAHYNAGALYARAQQHNDAERAYRAALSVRPDFVPAVVGLAALLEGRGDVAGAEALLRPHAAHSEAAAHLAQLLARAQRFDEARELAVAALKQDETNGRAMLAMGMIYRRQGKFELAHLALMQAIEVAPSLGEAYNELGLVLLAQNDKPKAVVAFEKAARAAPHIAAIHNNLGVLRSEVGAFKAAVESLQEATRLAPERAEYYLNLGNALRGDQRYVEAEAAYKKAHAGGNTDALFNLGVLYLDNELGGDPLTRYTTCIQYLTAYTKEGAPSPSDRARVAEYVKTAEKAIDNEQKRMARERQRAEKEAEKRKQAERDAAKTSTPDGVKENSP